MHADIGDTIAIPGRHVGEVGRIGQVLDVRGHDGGPPYLIRWNDGHEAVCYPGPETRIEHGGRLASP